MLRIYVAGPMRRIAEFNFPAFAKHTNQLRYLGHTVFSPAERDLEKGFDPKGMTGFEDLNDGTHRFDLRDALGADLEWIAANADALCLLPGWENSTGVAAELSLAAALGLKAGPLEDFIEGRELSDASDLVHKSVAWRGPQASDGEVRTTSATGAEKGVKPERFDLIPVGPLTELARHYGVGSLKYDDHNWRKRYEWSKSYAAAQRHLNAFWGGEDLDPETGSKHVIAAAWHCFTLAENMDLAFEYDDRWPPEEVF